MTLPILIFIAVFFLVVSGGLIVGYRRAIQSRLARAASPSMPMTPGPRPHELEEYYEDQFEMLNYLGKDGLLAPFLEPQFAEYPAAKRGLITHGSRRTGANPEIEKLAQILNAKTAYWANEPFLEQIIEQISDETKSICIVPYFLFSGNIPAAIANQITEFSQTYPNVQFHLGKPFGIETECATAIAQILNRIEV